MREAAAGRLYEAVDEAPQPGRGQDGTPPVELAGGAGVAALRHPPEEQHERGQGDGQVQQERGAPAAVIDEPAAEHRPHGRGHGAEGRPGPDRSAALFLRKRSRDDGEAAGDEQRSTHSLEGPGHDQQPNARGQATEPGRPGEDHDSDRIDPPPAELVSQRAAYQQEG